MMNRAVCYFVLFSFLTAAALKAEDTKVFFATGEWIPFTSKTLAGYGAATELVSAICKAAGIQPVYKFYPWSRAEKMVAKGKAFAAFPYVATDARRRRYDFSDTLFYGADLFVYYAENQSTSVPVLFNKLSDLRGYRVGGIRGSHFEKSIIAAGINYESTTDAKQSIQKLKSGRIDFYLDNPVVAFNAIQQLFPKQVPSFKTLPKPYKKATPNALLVSRAYPGRHAILEKFNAGLSLIKRNGEYTRIIGKYNMLK